MRFTFNGTDSTPGPQIAITQGDQTAGYLTVNADGSFQFVPSLRYKDAISFSYTIFDGEYESTAWDTVNVYNKLVEHRCRAATVPAKALPMSIISRPGERPAVLRSSRSRTISVGHNAPQASDSSFDVLHDTDLSGDILSLGYDLDGDALNITAINGRRIFQYDPTAGGNDAASDDSPPYYFGQPISLPSGATLAVFADGTFNYSPPPNYTGSDSFTFTLSDGLDSTSATINIFLYNNAPVATGASYSILHDTTLTGEVYGYDLDGDPITAHLVSGPTNGTVSLNPDGTFVYTPNTHFVGTDSFTFTFSDPLGPGNTATVRIDVYTNAPVGPLRVLGKGQ